MLKTLRTKDIEKILILNVQDIYQCTDLHLACKLDFVEIVWLLIETLIEEGAIFGYNWFVSQRWEQVRPVIICRSYYTN